MNIVLKSLKIYEGMSEETTAFTADVFVNGKKVAYAKNDGQGGSTYYHLYQNADKELLQEAEKYCETLPDLCYGDMKIKMSLENFIDDIVDKAYSEKQSKANEKKLVKNMEKGLCVGTADNYSVISWVGYTIPQLLSLEKGRQVITNKIIQLKRENPDVNILNNNIPKNIFSSK